MAQSKIAIPQGTGETTVTSEELAGLLRTLGVKTFVIGQSAGDVFTEISIGARTVAICDW